MTLLKSTVIASVASLALLACGSDEVVPDTSPPPTTLDHMVDADPHFMMFGDTSESRMTVRVNRGDGWETHDVTLDLSSGHVSFQTARDGTMDIDGLQLYYNDIVLDEETFPPNGLHLTDIRVSLPEPKACDHVAWTPDDDYCQVRVETPLLLDWTLVSDGAEYELGTQELDGMGVDFDIYQMVDPGEFGGRTVLALDTTAHAPGVVWEWGGMVEFSNLRLTAHGSELIPLGL